MPQSTLQLVEKLLETLTGYLTVGMVRCEGAMLSVQGLAVACGWGDVPVERNKVLLSITDLELHTML